MKTFSMEMEIRKVTQQYINPLVRCSDCGHRVCRCNDDLPAERSRPSDRDIDVAADARERAEEFRRG